MHHTLQSRACKLFQVQLYKNNALAILLRILCILNSDWLRHSCSVREVYEHIIIFVVVFFCFLFLESASVRCSGYCLNGGTCDYLESIDLALCACPLGYTGNRCQSKYRSVGRSIDRSINQSTNQQLTRQAVSQSINQLIN